MKEETEETNRARRATMGGKRVVQTNGQLKQEEKCGRNETLVKYNKE
jgi:hypothetical protein